MEKHDNIGQDQTQMDWFRPWGFFPIFPAIIAKI